MARQDDKSSSSYIPMDIIESILSRLPAKSLLRFKSVSESWNTMISDPRFVQTHLQQSKNSISHNLFLATSSKKISLLRLEDRKFQTEATPEGPERRGKSSWETVLCSCDGVLLLRDSSFSSTFLLWNPSTRQSASFCFPYRFLHAWNYGLCHDTTIDDFKVIVFAKDWFAVYSCKNKSWKDENIASTRTSRIRGTSGIFVDGAVYWDGHHTIVYFDPSRDEFEALAKPRDLKCSDAVSLICLRNRLCVWFNNLYESAVRVWIKDEGRGRGSWTEFMTIENSPVPVASFDPLYFREDKIVIRLHARRFLVYSPREKTFEEFRFGDSELFKINLVPYVDSLVFYPIDDQEILPRRKRKRVPE